MTKIDLAGTWRLENAEETHVTDIPLPGDAISGLYQAGLIPDPYWGRNEYDLRWIAESDWTLTREVTLDKTDLVLVLDQVDTIAEISVNGQQVLTTNNAFRRYRVDVSDVAKVGQNSVSIKFPAITRIADQRQADQPFPVPHMAANSPIANGNMIRKPQCDFGWDWNIALAPFGVYGAMHLEEKSHLRIAGLTIKQVHRDGAVDLCVTAQVEGSGNDQVEFVFDGQTLLIETTPDQRSAKAQFSIENPNLWWPVGSGNQPLYDLEVRVGDQREVRKIGIRDIKLVTENDEFGQSFAFQINGQPIFARGANWIPADALPSRIDPQKTRDLLQAAVDANMNMIRVWGGGRYEPDWFYDICDELGLLVWQDFMFACNLYPSTDDFLAEVDGEVREAVSRLHYRACLALWCGDNELVGALDWFKESRDNRDRYLVSYDRLNRTVESALKEIDPNANWWPSSPSRGRLDFGDGWHDDGTGDMHFWSVWHEGQDFDHYRDVSPRFCSEFGFQSYPSMDQIRNFADPQDFNIAAPVFASHQKNEGGNARIAETMFRYFRFPQKFEDFVYLSQVQQALAVKTAVTHWRSLKPRCMGTLYWQLNDTWPVCSWSSLDYGGGWKILHHAARQFYASVLVTAVPDGERISLRAVNDHPKPITVSLEAQAMSPDGEIRSLGLVEDIVPSDRASELLRLDRASLGNDEILVFSWHDNLGGSGEDHFVPRPYKSYNLINPELTVEQNGLNLILTSKHPAFFVAVEADQPGRFSENGFLLKPNDPKTIEFSAKSPGQKPNFTVRDLFSATCKSPSYEANHA